MQEVVIIKQATTPNQNATTSSTPQESLLYRSILGVGVIATLATYSAGTEIISQRFIIIGLLILIYILSTIIIQRHFQDSDNLETALNQINQMDALLLGCFVALIDFGLLPTGIFFTVVQYNALSRGGLRLCAQANLAFFAGILIIIVFREPYLQIELSQPANSIALIVFAIYFCLLCIYIKYKGFAEKFLFLCYI